MLQLCDNTRSFFPQNPCNYRLRGQRSDLTTNCDCNLPIWTDQSVVWYTSRHANVMLLCSHMFLYISSLSKATEPEVVHTKRKKVPLFFVLRQLQHVDLAFASILPLAKLSNYQEWLDIVMMTHENSCKLTCHLTSLLSTWKPRLISFPSSYSTTNPWWLSSPWPKRGYRNAANGCTYCSINLSGQNWVD